MSLALLLLTCWQKGPQSGVHLVTDEAESVLGILSQEQSGQSVSEEAWKGLFATDGYKRLKAREAGMQRKFEDADFRKFVESPDTMGRREALSKALGEWKKADVDECRNRALAYLPKRADIEAKIYILIKPLKNSFVWEVEKDPAIMLYLDPEESPEAFAGTVSHEMHHIGYGRSCPSAEFKSWLLAKPKSLKTAFMWMGAFGEGFAVLAAAGGIGHDPQSWAKPDVQSAWNDGMSHKPEQFKEVEQFFLQVCSGKLDEDQAMAKARDFYAIVGPWYTVGYTMATTIEKSEGRSMLIACYRDPRLLLKTYNECAQKLDPTLPRWSDTLLKAFRG